MDRPISTGEFGATFVLISDKAGYYGAKDNLVDFYEANPVPGLTLKRILRGHTDVITPIARSPEW